MGEPIDGATPGPWNVRSDPDANVVFVESEVPFQLVVAACGKANSPVAQANAALIAKARHLPALVDALEGVRDWADEYDVPESPFAEVRAALALVQDEDHG